MPKDCIYCQIAKARKAVRIIHVNEDFMIWQWYKREPHVFHVTSMLHRETFTSADIEYIKQFQADMFKDHDLEKLSLGGHAHWMFIKRGVE